LFYLNQKLLKQIILTLFSEMRVKPHPLDRRQSAAYGQFYCMRSSKLKLLKRVKMGQGIISLFLMCVI